MEQDRVDLVTAAHDGDRDAMSALIARELPWVRAVIAGYLRNADAVDDLCQEVFLSAWQAIATLRRPAGFKPWLYRITVNKVRSYFRGARRRAWAPLVEDVPASDASAGGAQADRRDAVKAALATLPSQYRDPLVIHYLNGKSCEETAKILGLKPVTARIRLLRGRRKLEEMLRKEGVV